VILVLDASVAASWLLKRTDPSEIHIAGQAVESAQRHGIKVPVIWYAELTNALLLAERRCISTPASTTRFLADLATLIVAPDSADPASTQRDTLILARSLHLTTYDASYLELAIRSRTALATFDRKLAEAARSTGISVFGDPS